MVVGTARCAVRAAFGGATSVVGHRIAHVPPAIRAVTARRAIPTNKPDSQLNLLMPPPRYSFWLRRACGHRPEWLGSNDEDDCEPKFQSKHSQPRQMPKPVIWTIDDDPDVLRAVERDLRRHYGDRYRVISADSGTSAMEGVRQLKLRNESIALFLVDQRMPRMNGVEFLEKAIELYPDAKRALLTAYADTDAAIRAINNAHIDHYLMKPWDPPEDRLYPVIDDVLDDWQAAFSPRSKVFVSSAPAGQRNPMIFRLPGAEFRTASMAQCGRRRIGKIASRICSR